MSGRSLSTCRFHLITDRISAFFEVDSIFIIKRIDHPLLSYDTSESVTPSRLTAPTAKGQAFRIWLPEGLRSVKGL